MPPRTGFDDENEDPFRWLDCSPARGRREPDGIDVKVQEPPSMEEFQEFFDCLEQLEENQSDPDTEKAELEAEASEGDVLAAERPNDSTSTAASANSDMQPTASLTPCRSQVASVTSPEEVRQRQSSVTLPLEATPEPPAKRSRLQGKQAAGGADQPPQQAVTENVQVQRRKQALETARHMHTEVNMSHDRIRQAQWRIRALFEKEYSIQHATSTFSRQKDKPAWRVKRDTARAEYKKLEKGPAHCQLVERYIVDLNFPEDQVDELVLYYRHLLHSNNTLALTARPIYGPFFSGLGLYFGSWSHVEADVQFISLDAVVVWLQDSKTCRKDMIIL